MRKILVIYVMLIFSVFIFAEEKQYVIATFPIPLMVESSEKGLFIDLVKEISKRSNKKITVIVEPPKRVVKGFEDKTIIGFFPALDVMITSKVARSENIYVKRDFVFVKKGNAFFKSIKELEGKKIGITLGYPYDKKVIDNQKIIFELVNEDETNMKKLAAGRIEGFIVEEKSGIKAMENIKATDIDYDKSSPISEQDVYFAFQDTKDGKELSEIFSKHLVDMKKDGTLEKILNKK